MRDLNLEKITQKFNQKLLELDKSSTAVSAYIGLLQYRKDYLHTIRTFHKGSIEEKMLQDSYLKRIQNHFPESQFGSIEEAIKTLEELAKPAIELNEQYQNSIKSYYLDSGLELNAVRVLSPKQIGSIIPRSKGLLSQFEEEQGNWVFASSTPKEENAYLARCQGKGMLGMGNNMYYYPNSSLHFEDGRLLIEPKGYIYYMDPDDFTPVTTVKRTRDGSPQFIFGDEWTCPRDISIETDVKRVEEYSDVTFLLEHLQLFSGSDEGITRELFSCGGPRRMDALKRAIASGKVQYLNGILNINTIDEFLNLRHSPRSENTNDIRREKNGEYK